MVKESMKLIILQVFLGVVFLNLQCSSIQSEKVVDDNSSTTFQNNTSSEKSNNNGRQIESMGKAVKELSSEYDVTNLRDKRFRPEDMELRIWSSIGFDYERSFILTKLNEKWDAYLIKPKYMENEIVRTKRGKIVSEKTDFSNPKSGWQVFDEYLTDNGIRYPLNYSLDEKNVPPILDEGVIILEVKQGKDYSLVFYREFTKSDDGKKLLKFCREVQAEFNVIIGCGN